LDLSVIVELYKAGGDKWGGGSWNWKLLQGQVTGVSSGSQRATWDAPTSYKVIIKGW